jgi:hypothetical protein
VSCGCRRSWLLESCGHNSSMSVATGAFVYKFSICRHCEGYYSCNVPLAIVLFTRTHGTVLCHTTIWWLPAVTHQQGSMEWIGSVTVEEGGVSPDLLQPEVDVDDLCQVPALPLLPALHTQSQVKGQQNGTHCTRRFPSGRQARQAHPGTF